MVDYDYSSGEGTLRIRDLGSTIEFWVRAGYTSFRWDGLDFSVTANGSTTQHSINYATGADWQRITTKTVTSTQTIGFRLLTATGTSSLGGPTTVSRVIDRGSVPSPPSAVRLFNIKATVMDVSFTDGDDGGLPIDYRQIAYATTNSKTNATFVDSTNSRTIGPLNDKTLYYVWARTRNAKGYSDWSTVRYARTLSTPDAPGSVTFSSVGQSSVVASFKDNSNNGAAITSRQIAYNTVNTLSTATSVTSDGSTLIANLTPGVKYYFWARAFNAVGWGPYSLVSSVQLLGGVWINYNGVWKRGVPYVRVNGVWKVGEPYGKNGGFWKKYTQ